MMGRIVRHRMDDMAMASSQAAERNDSKIFNSLGYYNNYNVKAGWSRYVARSSEHMPL